MQIVLEIVSGPQAGKRAQFKPGHIGQVGRAGWADLSLPQDAHLSGMHFALECGHDACRLRDLNSASGTLLNGVRVTQAIVRDGDQIVAGQTSFVVRLGSGVAAQGSSPSTTAQGGTPPPSVARDSAAPRDLLEFLRGQSEPLFALLDAARDFVIPDLIRGSGEEYQSLYEGPEGEELADFAPYLVRLPFQSPFLETLVQKGWGNSWGIYLTCNQPFKEVRKHFRHFIKVKLEGQGEVYFRFYDPRVLRIFLPTCTPKESAEFFGPVSGFIVEAVEQMTLIRFTRDDIGINERTVAISATAYPGNQARFHPAEV
jgi:hypothetical protein